MSTKIIETLLLLLSIASMLSPQVEGIQSNQTCVPIPKDKRQIVCQCSRSLQLRCLYNPEMLRMDASYLDATLRPIFYDDVNLDRIADPEDAFDPNTDFVSNRAKYSGSKNKFYIYFPNFEILTTPFVRITLTKFLYVPSFAFVNRQSGSRQRRQIESVVFELPNAFDFGIDENAFSSVDVTDTLLIEGPFNQINIHTNAFRNAKINELIFGCYCIECEYFIGECKLNFNQQASKKLLNGASAARRNNKKSTSGEISTEELIVNTTIKSIKLYGVEFNLNIDQIPGMESVQRLEITNLKSKSQPEFRSTRIYPKITEFYFKNNKLKQLSSLNAFYLFTNLRVASFAQNDIEKLDRDAFKFASLKSLEVLNLERNKIEKIERSIFGSSENLSNLKVLNLKQNNIQSIDDRAFAALEKLETLDLSRNRLNYLNENTFFGLKRLENLLLSYNPFKSFDVNTFKFVGGTLNRLDLVSNSESDWFTFDDSDVCLLSYLKCGVKIYINSDQRCNCFVKYLNYIGSSAAVESSSEDSEENLDNNDDPSVVWFKPCQFLDTPSSNLNKYFDEMNSFYEDLDSSSHVGVHGPKYNNIHSASGASDQKTSCPKQAIQSCFASSAAINTQSCLYRRFILNETILTTTQKSQATTLKQNEQSDSLESTIVLNKGSSQQQNKQYQTRQASEEQAKKGSSGDNAAPLVWRKFSLEDSLTALTVGITLAFVLSFISLFIGVYLIYKRKTFVYHPANDSSYPNDER